MPAIRVCICALLAAAGQAFAAPGAQPAELMPRAARTTVLDITHTGERFVAVGDRGHILVSADGREWTQKPGPVRRMLNRVRFADARNGWAVGYDQAILHTADGGETWALQHFDSDAGSGLFDVLFLDAQRGFVVGANGFLMRSADGGRSWQPLEAEFISLGLHLFNLVQLGDGSLLVAGERGLLARSADQGETWQMLSSPYAGSWFGVLPFGARGVVGFGLRGNVYVSDDVSVLQTQNPSEWDEFTINNVTDPAALAAMGWRRLDNPRTASLFGGTQLADGRYLLVGINGSMVVGDAQLSRLQALPPVADVPLADALAAGDFIVLAGRNGLGTLPGTKLP